MKKNILTGLYEAPEVIEISIDDGMVLCESFTGNTVEDWTEENI